MHSSPDNTKTREAVPLLAMRGISKRFGGVTALDGVDLEAEDDRFLSLLEANDSGKATFSRIIAGELIPDAGTMELRPIDRPYLTARSHLPHLTARGHLPRDRQRA